MMPFAKKLHIQLRERKQNIITKAIPNSQRMENISWPAWKSKSLSILHMNQTKLIEILALKNMVQSSEEG